MLEKILVCGAAFALGCAVNLASASAQDQGKTDAAAAPAAAPANPPSPNWATSCAAPSRAGPFECAIEQRVLVKETGQQLGRLVIKVSGDEPRTSGLLVQLPLGISLRAGVKLSIDGKKLNSLDVQTCDNSGCFAGAPASAELIAAMKLGKELRVDFQNLQQTQLNINFVLSGFKAGFAKVE